MPISITFDGRECLFDDTTFNPASPGLIRGCWVQGHFYEEHLLTYIHSLNLGGAYVDVGAHVGNHTLFLAVLTRADHVFAFEPLERSYKELVRNVELNKQDSRVTVFRCGADDRSGVTEHTFGRRTWTFPVERIDAVVDTSVSLMKLDVEGMELRALKGAREILERDHPLVFAEAHDDKVYSEIKEWLSLLRYKPTGKVFNRTPTYEFAHREPDPIRERLKPARLAHGLAWRSRRLLRLLNRSN